MDHSNRDNDPTNKKSKKARKQTKKKGNQKASHAKSRKNLGLDSSFCIAAIKTLQTFRENEMETKLEFPPDLDNTQRQFIHKKCRELGLQSKSYGKGENRRLTISKKAKPMDAYTLEIPPPIKLNPQSKRIILEFASRFAQCKDILIKKHDVSAKTSEGSLASGMNKRSSHYGGPTVPLSNTEPQRLKKKQYVESILPVRQQLPAWECREKFLESINRTQVVIVSGETGCGKSTQIPQFILDDPLVDPNNVNILVSQPRRISAITLAERVASERCESVGGVVGYNIRLDHVVGPSTRLQFCTAGLLLRRVTSDPMLKGVTHIVLDEVHERDCTTDFLLLVIREILLRRKDLKLIIMSATIRVKLFADYFLRFAAKQKQYISEGPDLKRLHPECIHMKGRMFPVAEYYLENILAQTKYLEEALPPSLLKKLTKTNNMDQKSHTSIAEWQPPPIVDEEAIGKLFPGGKPTSDFDGYALEVIEEQSEQGFTCELCGTVLHSVDEFAMHVGICTGEENISANSEQTSTTKQAAQKPQVKFNDMSHVEDDFVNPYSAAQTIVDQGSSPQDHEKVSSSRPTNLVDSAVQAVVKAASNDVSRKFRQHDRDYLENEHGSHDLSSVKAYERISDEESIDGNLIACLIARIVKYQDTLRFQLSKSDISNSVEHEQLECAASGAILVFLPGWDDIIRVKNSLESNQFSCPKNRLWILPLHSGVSPKEQAKVFKRANMHQTKVVLSTNIAETSVTVDDVVYVIDTGRAKQNAYDPFTGCSSLTSQWISRASSRQRAGRAGRVRPGICYHLFSKERCDAMDAFDIPEMHRISLEELCLKVKLLNLSDAFPEARQNAFHTSTERPIGEIERILSLALEPPSDVGVRRAIQLLIDIDALSLDYSTADNIEILDQHLTPLGECLASLPMPPKLGKAVLYSMLFQCLDPMITICCALSYRSPFILPMDEEERRAARKCQFAFANGNQSDHTALLEAYEGFEIAYYKNYANSYCRDNFLSYPTLFTIMRMREQIVDELVRCGLLQKHEKFYKNHDGNHFAGGKNYNQNSDRMDLIITSLSAGLYPSIGRARGRDMRGQQANNGSSKIDTRIGIRAKISRGSVNASIASSKHPSPTTLWVLFSELIRQRESMFLRDTTLIPSLTLAIVGGIIDTTKHPKENINPMETLIDEEENEDSLYISQSPRHILSLAYHTESKRARYFRKHFQLMITEQESVVKVPFDRENWHILSLSGSNRKHVTRSGMYLPHILSLLKSKNVNPYEDLDSSTGSEEDVYPDGRIVPSQRRHALICIDEWISLSTSEQMAAAIAALRICVQEAFNMFILEPIRGSNVKHSKGLSTLYTQALQTVSSLLHIEFFGCLPEQSMNVFNELHRPQAIPKPINNCQNNNTSNQTKGADLRKRNKKNSKKKNKDTEEMKIHDVSAELSRCSVEDNHSQTNNVSHDNQKRGKGKENAKGKAESRNNGKDKGKGGKGKDKATGQTKTEHEHNGKGKGKDKANDGGQAEKGGNTKGKGKGKAGKGDNPKGNEKVQAEHGKNGKGKSKAKENGAGQTGKGDNAKGNGKANANGVGQAVQGKNGKAKGKAKPNGKGKTEKGDNGKGKAKENGGGPKEKGDNSKGKGSEIKS